jgi:cell division protein FtsQ
MDARIASRRAEVRADRRRSRLRRTVGGLLLLGLIATAAWVERSPWLAIVSIDVEGTERLDPVAVREAAAVRLGSPILRVRVRGAVRQVEELTLVRSATVRRAARDRIVIEVVERRPILVVLGDRAEVLIDRDGVVVDRGRAPGLPVVVLRATPPPPGGTVADVAALANAHRV